MRRGRPAARRSAGNGPPASTSAKLIPVSAVVTSSSTAIEAGADLFVSGEISEQTTHLARESGVPFVAAGHHATERYGIQALSAYLGERLGLDSRFEDLPNPA